MIYLKMKDFSRNTSGTEMTHVLKGKIIASVHNEDGMDDFLVFLFTDGSSLRIRYDYIYEWEVTRYDEESG